MSSVNYEKQIRQNIQCFKIKCKSHIIFSSMLSVWPTSVTFLLGNININKLKCQMFPIFEIYHIVLTSRWIIFWYKKSGVWISHGLVPSIQLTTEDIFSEVPTMQFAPSGGYSSNLCFRADCKGGRCFWMETSTL